MGLFIFGAFLYNKKERMWAHAAINAVLSGTGRSISDAPPRKKEQDANRDKWIGVGGKFEDKESPEDCLVRECWEETGLTLTEYRYRGLVTFVNTQWPTEYMHLFTATGWTGTPHPCDEGELEWIPKAELRKLPMWAGDRIFLRLLDSNEPFFSLKLCYDGERLLSAVLNGKPLEVEA